MNQLNKLVFGAAIILISTFLFAQDSAKVEVVEKIVLGYTVNINSQILGEERPVIVYLPEGYHQSKNKYPVLYLLDGGGHFHHATGIIQFLSRNGRMPQTIVVAIPNTDRRRDFTPSTVKEMQNSGGADNFLNFMQNELIPLIENSYRTQPYRILFGHSLTAMFSIYTLAARPDLFNAYIAASPYLMYDDEIVIKKVKDSFTKNAAFNKSLYMTIGNEPIYVESLGKFTGLLDNNSSNGLEWKFVKMESEDHGTIPHKTIYDGLEFIFSGWRIPTDLATSLTSIDEHYKSLSKKFGYEILAPEFLLNRLGYQVLGQEEIEKAIQIFKQNVKTYPESVNVYDSLGEAFEKAGDIKMAEKNYKIAVQTGEKLKDPNLNIYKINLERVQKQL
jgi:predicted alpha/beta superfamily hydrolase